MDKDLEIKQIIEYANSIQQPRSNFQLKNFVMGQHDTEPMQFYQLCIEISELYYNISVAELELEKMKIKKSFLDESDNPIDKIDSKIIQINIDKTSNVIDASKSEFQFLISEYKKFEKKYSRKDIEDNQLSYWKSRLQRQAALEQVAVSTSQSEHFNSLRQIGLISVSNGNISWNDRQIQNDELLEIEQNSDDII